uniref:Uncharacterized protein n=1 Tax=Terrapene triunguis TaxID=2587831 RepID=A0A674JT80_9SAUR
MGKRLLDQMLIFSSLSAFQSFHITILELNSADNLTALYRLHFNELVSTIPTKGFNSEKVKGLVYTYPPNRSKVHGPEKLRPLWKLYTRCTDDIVLVVDSVHTKRREEAIQTVPVLLVMSFSTPRHLQPTCAIIQDGLEEELNEDYALWKTKYLRITGRYLT